MRKPLLLCFSVVTFFQVHGQETVNVDGNIYKVYPYRMEDAGAANLQNLEDMDVPFFPKTLEDGQYAVLFARHSSLQKPEEAAQLKLFETWPAATFRIQNGIKEGPVTFYTKLYNKQNKRMVLAYGNYNAGIRHGRWVMYSHSVITGMAVDSSYLHFRNGVLHGSVMENSTLHGSYENGLKSGIWNYRYSKQEQYDSGYLHGMQTDSGFHIMLRCWYHKGQAINKIQFFTRNNGELYAELLLRNSDAEKMPGLIDSGQYYVGTKLIARTSEINYHNFAPTWLADFLEQAAIFNRHSSRGHLLVSKIPETWQSILKYAAFDLCFYQNQQCTSAYHFIGEYIRVNPGKWSYQRKLRKYSGEWGAENWNDKLGIGLVLNRKERRRYWIDTARSELIFIRIDSTGSYWKEVVQRKKSRTVSELRIQNYSVSTLRSETYNWEDGEYKMFVGYNEKMRILAADPNYFVQDSTVQEQRGSNYKTTTKGIWLKNRNEWTNVKSRESADPWLPENRVMALTGKPKLQKLDSVTWVYVSYHTDFFGEHRMEWLLPDTIRRNQPFSENLTSDRDRITKAFQFAEIFQATAYLNNLPYTGQLRISRPDYTRRKLPDPLVVSYYININYAGLSDTSITVYLSGKWLGSDHLRAFCNYYDGKLSGVYNYETKSTLITAEYTGGVLHGNWISERNGRVSRIQHYHFGNRNGLQMNFTGFDPGTDYRVESYYNIHRRKFEGPAISSEENYRISFNVVADTLQGAFRKFHNQSITDSLVFSRNLPHQHYQSYYQNYNGEKRLRPKLVANFDHGAIYGKVISYFPDDGISAIAHIQGKQTMYRDSLYPSGMHHVFCELENPYLPEFHPPQFLPDSLSTLGNSGQRNLSRKSIYLLPGKYINFYFQENILEFQEHWNAYYQYFYKGKTGIKSMEGMVNAGKRVGWWHFYTETGQKYKSILYNFKDSGVASSDKAAKAATGFCRGYNNAGIPAYEGFILDQDFNASCATTASISFEDLYYTAIYDSAGNNLLFSGKPVPISERHITGATRFQGWWHQGARDSIWLFYSSNGMLSDAGKYLHGMKNGRWISGDLGGINALDNSCFAPGEEWRILPLLKDLDFKEEIYENGTLLAQQRTSVQADGRTRNNYRFEYFKQTGKPKKGKKYRRSSGWKPIPGTHYDF